MIITKQRGFIGFYPACCLYWIDSRWMIRLWKLIIYGVDAKTGCKIEQ